ncbi:hypothetical protein GHT06_011160 [Daphnia sinensis]|uniref:Uncharacterized protein n=1 Tax=Daphnia sinensis TaxID=1820382 RepID=A0AAD5LJ61_9CRUS|nr:hypothetical protein GHT06_011160 [Daphnia sinensis]
MPKTNGEPLTSNTSGDHGARGRLMCFFSDTETVADPDLPSVASRLPSSQQLTQSYQVSYESLISTCVSRSFSSRLSFLEKCVKRVMNVVRVRQVIKEVHWITSLCVVSSDCVVKFQA